MIMSDLISRQAVLDTLKGFNVINIISYEHGVIYVQAVINAIYNRLNNLPSAELERKKGEWIYDGKRGRFPACKCSICGHYENADWAILQGVNFCPHCGADMRGE